MALESVAVSSTWATRLPGKTVLLLLKINFYLFKATSSLYFSFLIIKSTIRYNDELRIGCIDDIGSVGQLFYRLDDELHDKADILSPIFVPLSKTFESNRASTWTGHFHLDSSWRIRWKWCRSYRGIQCILGQFQSQAIVGHHRATFRDDCLWSRGILRCLAIINDRSVCHGNHFQGTKWCQTSKYYLDNQTNVRDLIRLDMPDSWQSKPSTECLTCYIYVYKNMTLQSSLQVTPDIGKLILCIVIDVIGTSSELIPIAGELTDVAWAPIAAIALRSIYGSNIIFALEFVEEILPFTDILPLATLWYVNRFSYPTCGNRHVTIVLSWYDVWQQQLGGGHILRWCRYCESPWSWKVL